MTKSAIRLVKQLAVVVACTWTVSASAQVPVPSNNTPTLRGGTPIVGNAVSGEIGYAALRTSLYFGSTGDRDVGVELSAPTFGDDALPGYGQSLGLDARVPLRFRIVQWPKATGSFKVGPYFAAGRLCSRNSWGGCSGRSVQLGPYFGFVTDIALPKLFKLIVGIEQQMGLYHVGTKNGDYKDNAFAGATWIDLGLEAFWKEKVFFTMIINVGAQYGSDELYYNNHALYRHLLGAGYKWK